MGESEADLQRQLAERIRRLDLESYKKAEEFIEGWKRLTSDPRYLECPHSCFWRTCIANHAEGAALLGLTDHNPQDHRPHVPIRCFAPCVICNPAEPGEEQRRVQGLFDQLGDFAAAREKPPESSGDRVAGGGKPSKGGNGEASNQGQQQVCDKGKAKVQDSWCTKWVEKAEASRRRKEEKEEVSRKQSQEERLKREEEQRLLEQLERFLPEKGERRKERAQKIREDAEADPELRAELVETSRFLVGWETQQWDCEEFDIPVEKVWPSHIANHPEVALNVNSEYRAELDQHLPRRSTGVS
jgi:hypothetical protein